MILEDEDPKSPNLSELENRGELIFIPFGGGHVRAWSDRFAPLVRHEFHLYDQELPPETQCRQQAALAVNRRPGCRAVLTSKRSLENYLHPDAIQAAGGIWIQYDDFDCVAKRAAREFYKQSPGKRSWDSQSLRSQNRMANRAKQWLNTIAVEHMTAKLLMERDPGREIKSWMQAIASFLED